VASADVRLTQCSEQQRREISNELPLYEYDGMVAGRGIAIATLWHFLARG